MTDYVVLAVVVAGMVATPLLAIITRQKQDIADRNTLVAKLSTQVAALQKQLQDRPS